MSDPGTASTPSADVERLRREVEQWRQRADAADARFESVVESLPHGVLVFGDDGQLAYANRAARSALAVPIGDDATSLVLSVDAPAGEARLELSARPIVWDGRPGSLVILSGVTARPAASAPAPAEGPGTFRCVVEELPAFGETFGAEAADMVASEVLDRLETLLAGHGTVRRRGQGEFVLVRSDAGRAEASELAAAIKTVAEDPIMIHGVPIAMSARVEYGLPDDHDTTPRGAAREASPSAKRDRVRGVLFSGPVVED